MNEYTPDTDEVLEAFVHMAHREAEEAKDRNHIDFSYSEVRAKAEAEFYRWLESVKGE